MEEIFTMTQKELDRHSILKKVLNKELSQVMAANLLKVSPRQTRNLLQIFKNQGSKGIISKKRGVPSNRTLPKELKQAVLALMREKYEGFGPTLAQEKLKSLDNLVISKETLRKWMIESHLWIPRKIRKKEHASRKRRPCFGELLQTDGSFDAWFGEDHPKANATVIIDDATSMITSIVFSQQETLSAYYQAFRQHMEKYGRPRAFYTDRYAVFQANNKVGKTHMQRSLKDLDIELILANSPQAKGRVERANRTLQDRLIKEFRLRGIKTIKEANLFMPDFLREYNHKFSKKPMSEIDAHRSLEGFDLSRLLSPRESRTLLVGSIFQYRNTFYKVQMPSNVQEVKGVKVEVLELQEGGVRVFYKNQELSVSNTEDIITPPLEMNRKEAIEWKEDMRKKPKDKSFPWKNFNIGSKRKKLKKYQACYNG